MVGCSGGQEFFAPGCHQARGIATMHRQKEGVPKIVPLSWTTVPPAEHVVCMGRKEERVFLPLRLLQILWLPRGFPHQALLPPPSSMSPPVVSHPPPPFSGSQPQLPCLVAGEPFSKEEGCKKTGVNNPYQGSSPFPKNGLLPQHRKRSNENMPLK